MLLNDCAYLTVEEANELASKYYTTTDELYIAWSNLSIADKRVYLRNATIMLNTLTFKGKSTSYLKFPRLISGKVVGVDVMKLPCLIQAMHLLRLNTDKRAMLVQSGVKSINLDGYVETFKDDVKVDKINNDVIELLKNYLYVGGHVDVRCDMYL